METGHKMVNLCTFMYLRVMSRLRVLKRPPGRHVLLCKNVRYRVRVDPRRETVGKRIQRARRAAKHKSAKSFAVALGISATSVARAEAGWDTTGASVYADIERGLNWPDEIIERYLETGDESLLEQMPVRGEVLVGSGGATIPGLVLEWTPEEIERVQALDPKAAIDEGGIVGKAGGPERQLEYLHDVLLIRRARPVFELDDEPAHPSGG